MRVTAAACLALTVLAGGCSLVVGGGIDEFGPADFAGSYTLTVTNGANDCEFANWRVNETSGNVPFTITQDGEDLTGTVEGIMGTLFTLVLGNNRATGTAEGSHFDLRLQGTRQQSVEGGCTSYNVDAIMEGDLDGDLLEGETTYTAVTTDGSAPCVELEGCETKQAFNGTRPPQ